MTGDSTATGRPAGAAPDPTGTDATASAGVPAPDAADTRPTRAEAVAATADQPSGRGRTALKYAVVLVLALVWIRFVLFAWLFPIIERRFDSPEIGPAEGEAEQVESLAELTGAAPLALPLF